MLVSIYHDHALSRHPSNATDPAFGECLTTVAGKLSIAIEQATSFLLFQVL
jgi:hypothetical protein